MVCGCSFSAPSAKPEFRGQSWSELLAEKLGWKLTNLARQGCSNGGIRIQIDEVIRQQPDFVVIVPTFHDRTEIPARAAPYDFRDDDWKGWNSDLQKHLQKSHLNGYDRSAGINNINYGNNPYRMICETIFSLAENYDHPYRSGRLDRDTQKAVKTWVNYLYDSEWKRQQDEWIIRDGIVQLYCRDIDFLLVPNSELWDIGDTRTVIPNFISLESLATEKEKTPSWACYKWPLASVNEDPGYHGAPESQQYLCDIYFEIIKNRKHL